MWQENTKKSFWFQLYVMRDKEFISRLLRRAQEAGCNVLQITMDLNILRTETGRCKNWLVSTSKVHIETYTANSF